MIKALFRVFNRTLSPICRKFNRFCVVLKATFGIECSHFELIL